MLSAVESFAQAWTDGGFSPRHRAPFNAAIARRDEGIRDYLVAHYRLARRTDTEFWRDNAGHDRLSDPLKSLMTCWFTGGDLLAEIARQDIARYYAPLSWACLFAGYGTFPADDRLRPAPASQPQLAPDFLPRCGLDFPPHAEALAARASPSTPFVVKSDWAWRSGSSG